MDPSWLLHPTPIRARAGLRIKTNQGDSATLGEIPVGCPHVVLDPLHLLFHHLRRCEDMVNLKRTWNESIESGHHKCGHQWIPTCSNILYSDVLSWEKNCPFWFFHPNPENFFDFQSHRYCQCWYRVPWHWQSPNKLLVASKIWPGGPPVWVPLKHDKRARTWHQFNSTSDMSCIISLLSIIYLPLI